MLHSFSGCLIGWGNRQPEKGGDDKSTLGGVLFWLPHHSLGVVVIPVVTVWAAVVVAPVALVAIVAAVVVVAVAAVVVVIADAFYAGVA